VLLISDGGDMEDDTLAAAEELKALGVPVHAIGLGDPVRGSLIPLTDRGGRRTYLEYQGEPVRTKLEDEVLRGIAQRTGGQYLSVGTGFVELDRWFGALVAGKAVRDIPPSGRSPTFVHRFQLFLLPAVVLLLLEVVLHDTRPLPAVPPGTGYFSWVRSRRRRAPFAASAAEKGPRS